VFATDAWFRRTVLGAPRTIDDVLAVRAERGAEIRRFLDALTPDGLLRTCAQNPVAGYPEDTKVTVHGCLVVLLVEEWHHRQYATRDLAVLEDRFGTNG
jgi:hypothetical protein